ncbi:thermonuclease family protein [Planctomycetes bacterium TBK1r]|uniref:Thermonuclease n=1 Tax=Stieleria magnilauensis TaxID=2527963 RepID=A0ABX5XIN4_9BACT|nr:Thermonuclease precursor [Planctomycetes bacterium TBK1r]
MTVVAGRMTAYADTQPARLNVPRHRPSPFALDRLPPPNTDATTAIAAGNRRHGCPCDGWGHSQMIRVRLIGIENPASGNRRTGKSPTVGDHAMQWLATATANASVRVVDSGTDRYGRTLAHLYVGDVWLNRELVASGLAWHYVKYNQDAELATAQHEARAANRGLWQDARRVAQWDYRNGQRIETALPTSEPTTRDTDATVCVTASGTKYHRAGCRYLGDGGTGIPVSRAVSAQSQIPKPTRRSPRTT